MAQGPPICASIPKFISRSSQAMSERSSPGRRQLPSGKVESLLTRLWLTLLLFAPNPSYGSSDYGDLNPLLTGVAEQNVASLCPRGLEANATNRHCRPQGKRAGESRFPYVCSVRKAGTRKHLCTATLVHRKWLLTTAHCVDPNSDDSAGCYPLIYCSSPVANAPAEEQVFHVVDAYLHEDWFGDAAYGSNVAMLKLDRNANYPIPRFFREWMFEGATMDVPLSRWVAEGKSSRKCGCCSCEVKNRNNDACQKYPQIVSKRSWLCIDGGETDNWTGEKGSPVLLADRPKGKLAKGNPSEDLLVGFMSFSTSDSDGKTCAVYTSVSFFRTWIMKTIGGKTKPSRCMFVPKAEPKKEPHDQKDQEKPAAGTQVGVAKEEPTASEKSEKQTEEVSAPEQAKTAEESEKPIATPSPVEETKTTEKSEKPIVTPSPVEETKTTEKSEKPIATPSPEAAKTTEKSEKPIATPSPEAAKTTEKSEKPIATPSPEAAKKSEQPVPQTMPLGTILSKYSQEELKDSRSHLDSTDTLLLVMAAAIKRDDEATVEWILGTGLDPNTILHEEGMNKRLLRDGSTLLHWTAAFDAVKCAKVLMAHSANTNPRSVEGETPLHVAAVTGSAAIARELIEHGANPKAAKVNGLTPLHYAAMTGHVDVAEILLEGGAKVDAPSTTYLWTPLHYASASGQAEMAKILLGRGANLEAVDVVGRTPLHCAAQWKNLNTAKVLIAIGASKTRRDENGKTPLDLVCSTDPAVLCRLEDLVNLLAS